jgi:hypothetical protein
MSRKRKRRREVCTNSVMFVCLCTPEHCGRIQTVNTELELKVSQTNYKRLQWVRHMKEIRIIK